MTDNTTAQSSHYEDEIFRLKTKMPWQPVYKHWSATNSATYLYLCRPNLRPMLLKRSQSGILGLLEKRLKQLKLDKPTDTRPSCIFRTKANCLRVCCQGPILVVYPDGVWYRQATLR